ncbi:hypothetical protein VTK73DRAFT_1694 [Phialemonium thermophilum]|uniref:DUF300-domain-containing protein n=1 Tax=Phialemonium thermophilum TaxID=223376 RepID=A0ABR3X7U9_9PEZI
MNLTCNSTLDAMRILPGSEIPIAGSLTFHQLALIIAAGSTLVAIAMSLYLIMMHATHYTKPAEQRYIIRILFMVPVYASASFLSLRFYWHAIYFQVISDCYEAFAIASFFALLCHYVAPDLHEQKEFFRLMQPIVPWVWPLNWFKKCCGGERGPWRTPASGLTWFNIIWIGIYHYCFIRVAMTITAVVTQYFERYCESSNNPVFSHIWVIAINAIAVTIAMYCVIQFYFQLRAALAEHSPFLKVLAIKLVIFLSFWQSAAISVGTSTLNLVHPNKVLAYPDIKVGIPSLLLCFEMALFAILHLWAFPYRPYLDNAKVTFYPVPDPSLGIPPRENEHQPRSGGFLGLRALWDAMNLWDVVKAFGRGVRWLFVGVKHRHEDVSYHKAVRKNSAGEEAVAGMSMEDLGPSSGAKSRLNADTAYLGGGAVGKSTDHLPIASEFRRSRYGVPDGAQRGPLSPRAGPLDGADIGDEIGIGGRSRPEYGYAREEHAGLIAHAQPDPHSPLAPPGAGARVGEAVYGEDDGYGDISAPYHGGRAQALGSAAYGRSSPLSTVDEESYRSRPASHYYGGSGGSAAGGPGDRSSVQLRVGEALWGPAPTRPREGQ